MVVGWWVVGEKLLWLRWVIRIWVCICNVIRLRFFCVV